jgi:hypothetical protein
VPHPYPPAATVPATTLTCMYNRHTRRWEPPRPSAAEVRAACTAITTARTNAYAAMIAAQGHMDDVEVLRAHMPVGGLYYGPPTFDPLDMLLVAEALEVATEDLMAAINAVRGGVPAAP